jgi:hypothetical protein
MAIVEVLSLVVIRTCFCRFVAVNSYSRRKSLLRNSACPLDGPNTAALLFSEVQYSITFSGVNLLSVKTGLDFGRPPRVRKDQMSWDEDGV